MIYLALYSVSTVFFYFAGRAKGLSSWFLAMIGMALPCLLAGMRNETVGTDVLVYAKGMCENALRMPILEFLKYEAPIAGAGWNAFTWITVRLTGNLRGYLFCIEALCIAPVYAFLRHQHKVSAWAGMLIWLLLDYGFSLNGMRQSAAISICIYSLIFVLDRRPGRFLICVLLAMQFHQTAIVMMLAYPFSLCLAGDLGFNLFFNKYRGVALCLIVIAMFIGAFAFGHDAVRIAANLKASYSYQMERLGSWDFSYAGLFLLMVSLMISVLSKGVIHRYTEFSFEYSLVCCLIVIGCIGWQFDLIASTLGRLGHYGSAFFSVQGSLLLEDGGTHAIACFAVLLVSSVIYFVAFYMMLGQSGIYPYESALLGI